MPYTLARFPLDDLLRRHGWQVARRAKSGEPMWHRHGVTLGQADALERLPAQEVEAARLADQEYLTRAA